MCGSFGYHRDDHYYRVQSEKRQIRAEKENIEKLYNSLMEEHRTLQSHSDDLVAEKDDALSRLREVQRDTESRRNEKTDVMLRAEIDRLRMDL